MKTATRRWPEDLESIPFPRELNGDILDSYGVLRRIGNMKTAQRTWPEDLVSIPFPTVGAYPSGGDLWGSTARQTDQGTDLRYHRTRG